MTKLGI